MNEITFKPQRRWCPKSTEACSHTDGGKLLNSGQSCPEAHWATSPLTTSSRRAGWTQHQRRMEQGLSQQPAHYGTNSYNRRNQRSICAKSGTDWILLNVLGTHITPYLCQQSKYETITLTILWCCLSFIGTPVAPATRVPVSISAAHLNDISAVWLKILQSEGSYDLVGVFRRYL